MELKIRTVILMIGVLLGSCIYRASTPIEVVMCPGDVIEYRASGGRSLKILATDDIERQYLIGSSLRFTVNTTPRPSRWFGSRGVYSPRGVGNTHITIEEAVQHFSSNEDMYEWLETRVRTDDDRMAAVDDSGLLVNWTYGARPPGHQGGPDYRLSVDVYQILVNLKEPQGLRPISDDVIIKNLSSACDAKALEPGYMPSKPMEISGRMYSGRAIDFMREQGIDAADVEMVIATGKRVQKGSRTSYHPKLWSKLPGVTLDASGKVIRVAF